MQVSLIRLRRIRPSAIWNAEVYPFRVNPEAYLENICLPLDTLWRLAADRYFQNVNARDDINFLNFAYNQAFFPAK
ncbi:hypothetical protein BU251_06170 [Candidatus Velamenicoccus archaeovorus]|uniref:Uncharacterized protein n=1 Tax=Velamenicoccus archaeovorus TaxID=1930593 RepID=A0A410P5F2_VELA1|nr:hypothetical protein BU251_06170 [Candidatus Velamenicoccus archaeovorus]